MPLFIEGVPVDNLLHEIYSSSTAQAAARGVRLQVEVIAWDELVAAADARWLRDILSNLVDDAISSSPGGNVLIQAYPCPDDVHLAIEVRDDRGCETALPDATGLAPLARTVRCMAGELTTFRAPDGGRSVLCQLPQWICGPADHACAA